MTQTPGIYRLYHLPSNSITEVTILFAWDLLYIRYGATVAKVYACLTHLATPLLPSSHTLQTTHSHGLYHTTTTPMSRAAKLTFGITSALTIGTITYVHFDQRWAQEALRQGPINDMERVKQHREDKQRRFDAMNDDEKAEFLRKEKVRKELLAEHDMQLKLKEQYEKVQPLSKS